MRLLDAARNFRAMVMGECPSVCENDCNSERLDDATNRMPRKNKEGK